ncbi:MAG: c-type cytochrome [Chthoniobacter sp.]|nr:c-type cytochrome [Chthoniobacter sp.]
MLFVAEGFAAAPSDATASAKGEYRLTDPELKLVTVDSDPQESFLGLAVDGMGRLFAGSREALFVYEPAAGGLYQPRRELFRFPKDAWVYDVAIRGHDLYVATTTALYRLRDGVVKREGLTAERLMWGWPVFHVHQGLHGMTFGPDGDLYLSLGDELVYYGDYRRRPDHFGHWPIYHGPDNTPMPYTGAGGVLRLSPDGRKLSVIANGTRNDCGLAFDEQWNLFGNDNDHEGMPNDYVPGRLLHITPHSYFNWPRGWMIEKQPWRSDLLDTLTADLGRYVPVGMTYYGDTFLGDKYRHALYSPEWGSRKIAYYPLQTAGDSFKTKEQILLTGDGDARPVSVAVGRGGRLFAVVCFMVHNEGSPMYRSDLVMITRANDAANAPFTPFDEVAASPEQLFAELENPNWSNRFRAHTELTRRGATAMAKLANLDAKSLTTPHLIWLAASNPAARSEVQKLALHADAGIRAEAVSALARFGVTGANEFFTTALKDSDPRVRQAALAGLQDQTSDLPFDAVVTAAGEEFSHIRQAADFLLAQRATVAQLRALCGCPELPCRRAGVVAIGFRLSLPPWDQPLDPSTSLDASKKDAYRITYAGSAEVVLTERAPMGNFTASEAWASRHKTSDDQALLDLLRDRLADTDASLAKQAAVYLRLLADAQTESQVNALLGFPAPPEKPKPIANATTTGLTELPEVYAKLDWVKEAAAGDPKHGQELFNTRGCTVCHGIKEGEAGGGAPSLAGAGSRFTAQYLVESVITPNKVVAPLFRWTLAKLKNGDIVTGLVTSETGAELEFLLPAGVRRTVKKADVVARELQDRSPMPEGLIQNPAELRDLVAFLLGQKTATKTEAPGAK